MRRGREQVGPGRGSRPPGARGGGRAPAEEGTEAGTQSDDDPGRIRSMGPGAPVLPGLRTGDLHLRKYRIQPGTVARGGPLRGGPARTEGADRHSESHPAGRCRTAPTRQRSGPQAEILLCDPGEVGPADVPAIREPRRAFLRSVQEILGRPVAACFWLRGMPASARAPSQTANDRAGSQTWIPAKAISEAHRPTRPKDSASPSSSKSLIEHST